MSSRYYLKYDSKPEQQVSREEFIAAERSCGFFPKANCGPVTTAGFGVSGPNGSINGRIEYDSPMDELTESGWTPE